MEIKLKNPTLFLSENTQGRDFYVGDIHGYLALFQEGLQQLQFNPEIDRVFCVGDLIDRGPDSMACLRLVKENWFFSVLGNHERLLFEYAKNDECIRSIGNNWQYKLSQQEKLECITLVEAMYWTITISYHSNSVGLVHADIPYDIDWDLYCYALHDNHSEMIEYATWSRKRFSKNPEKVTGIDWVFVGHQGLETPQVSANVICIDTGVYIPRREGKTSWINFCLF